MEFSENDILNKLDRAFMEEPDKDFPKGQPGDVYYNFFLDLEKGYTAVAGNKIHLFGDSKRWAVVFEQNGYETRGDNALTELIYIGNCVRYHQEKDEGRTYYSNSSLITVITQQEFERIRNKKGEEMEQFELVDASVKSLKVNGHDIKMEHDKAQYEAHGIHLRDNDNPHHLVSFSNLVRYLSETHPELLAASEAEIHQYLPNDLKKIMTIDKFHYSSYYDKETLPSKQEVFKLIAKVLTSLDPNQWKPTLPANNHWSNWESGVL